MTLSEKIVQRYPVSTIFAVAPHQSLYLCYEDTVSPAFRDALETTLRGEMSVHLEQEDGYRVVKAQIGAAKAGDAALLCVRCKGASYYFSPKTALREMPWVLRALADAAPWLAGCSGTVVTVRPYSAKQQSLALKLIRECQRQLEAGGDIATPAARIKEIIQEITVRRLDDRLPAFSDRPINEKGWELICDSNFPMRRGTQMSLGDLSEILYGKMDLEQEMENWVEFFCEMPFFDEELKRAKAKICTVIRENCRLADGDRAFAHARVLLNGETASASEEDVEKVFDAFDVTVNVRKLRPESLESLFSDVTLCVNRVLKRKIEEKVTQKLLDECETAMKQEMNACRAKLQAYYRELRDLCPMRGIALLAEMEMEYTWPQLAELRENLLATSVSGWSIKAFNDLSMNIPDLIYLRAWLMRRGLKAQMGAAHGAADVQEVDLSSSDVAVAVYGEPLAE